MGSPRSPSRSRHTCPRRRRGSWRRWDNLLISHWSGSARRPPSPRTGLRPRRRSFRGSTLRPPLRDRHARAPRGVRRSPARGRRASPVGRSGARPRRRLDDRVLPSRTRRRRPGGRCVRDPRHPSARGRARRRPARRAPRPPRTHARGRRRRDGPRLLPRPGAARSPARGLRSGAGSGGGPREAGRDPHPCCRPRDSRSARELRREGRASLLLVPGSASRRRRPRLLRLVRRQRQLSERVRAPDRRDTGPGRPHPGGDRQPLPRSAAGPGQAERARKRAAYARRAGRGARGGRCRARGPDRGERLRGVRSADMTAAPRKELGQHFLVDENILGVIGRLAELSPDDVVLEIGPGLGVLTRHLAERVAFVHAVESDRSLEPHLRLGERVRVELGDALRVDLAGLEPPARKLVSNLPYNVATPIVVESLDGLPTVDRWCVMVQREVADRFFARPGTKAYGAVSVLVQLAAERTGWHPVTREVFRPRPNVESALVAFRRTKLPPNWASVKRIVEAGFAHRRKTLPNSLALSGVTSRASAEEALHGLGRPPATRAEALEPGEFVALAEAL